MKIHAYDSDQVFSSLESEWNSLLEHSSSNLIFMTWQWQSTWWEVYRPGDLWVLEIRDDDGGLVGIAPWFIQTQEDGTRLVHTVGCADVTDYLSMIVHQEFEVEVYQALAQYLGEQQSLAFDMLDLCNIPEDSLILSEFRTALENAGLDVVIAEQDVCPIIDLPDDFADYVQGLSKKHRHELRRKMRKLESLGDELEWYVVDESHDLEEEMQHFLALMQSASEEKSTFLENAEHRAFFNQIVPIIKDCGWLQLSFVKIQGEYAAAYLNFLYNNEVLVYNSGLDIAVSKSFSPGIVLLGYLIEQAIIEKYDRFDFLRGNETYKYHMGGQDSRVMNLVARPKVLA